jgi:hypothetical protein
MAAAGLGGAGGAAGGIVSDPDSSTLGFLLGATDERTFFLKSCSFFFYDGLGSLCVEWVCMCVEDVCVRVRVSVCVTLVWGPMPRVLCHSSVTFLPLFLSLSPLSLPLSPSLAPFLSPSLPLSLSPPFLPSSLPHSRPLPFPLPLCMLMRYVCTYVPYSQ